MECIYRLAFVGNTLVETQLPVVSGKAAASSGKTTDIETKLQRCNVTSRTGVFRIREPESAAFPRIMHVHFTGGDRMPQKTVWLFNVRCPRRLWLKKEDGSERELLPAPGMRHAWHGGRIALLANEAEEEGWSPGERPQAFFSHSLVGTWQARRSRRSYADIRNDRPGCSEDIVLTVADRDPSLPLVQSYYAYDLRASDCRREAGLQRRGWHLTNVEFRRESSRALGNLRAPGLVSDAPANSGMAHSYRLVDEEERHARPRSVLRHARPRSVLEPPSESCPSTLAHRECDRAYAHEEEILVAPNTLRGSLGLLQIADRLHGELPVVRFELSDEYSNRTLQLQPALAASQAMLIAPSRCKFLALNITGNTSGLQVYRLTTERESITSLHQTDLAVDVPCTSGRRQRVRFSRSGQLPFEQVVERCLQSEAEWLDHRTDHAWSPGAKIFGLRSNRDDALPYVAALLYTSVATSLSITVSALPEALVCPPTYRGVDGSFGIRSRAASTAAKVLDDSVVPDDADEEHANSDAEKDAPAELNVDAIPDNCYGPCPAEPAFSRAPFAAPAQLSGSHAGMGAAHSSPADIAAE